MASKNSGTPSQVGIVLLKSQAANPNLGFGVLKLRHEIPRWDGLNSDEKVLFHLGILFFQIYLCNNLNIQYEQSIKPEPVFCKGTRRHF